MRPSQPFFFAAQFVFAALSGALPRRFSAIQRAARTSAPMLKSFPCVATKSAIFRRCPGEDRGAAVGVSDRELVAVRRSAFLSAGVPEGNRTPDPRFRKPVLYPAELPGRVSRIFGACRCLRKPYGFAAYDPFAFSVQDPRSGNLALLPQMRSRAAVYDRQQAQPIYALPSCEVRIGSGRQRSLGQLDPVAHSMRNGIVVEVVSGIMQRCRIAIPDENEGSGA